MLLVHAISSQFRKVRSFVFVDGLDEATRFFEETQDPHEAVMRINTEADVIYVDGHSDYGRALTLFHERYATDVSRRASVLVLGDARNNYHASQAWVLDDLRSRARAVYWLNPEPHGLLELRGLDRRRLRARTATRSSSAARCASSRSSWAPSRDAAGRHRGCARSATDDVDRAARARAPRRADVGASSASSAGRPATPGSPASAATRSRRVAERLAASGELAGDRALYASTLPRAIQTAELLAPALGDLDVVVRHDLREHDPGELDGLRVGGGGRALSRCPDFDRRARPPGRPGRRVADRVPRARPRDARASSPRRTRARPSSSRATAAIVAAGVGHGLRHPDAAQRVFLPTRYASMTDLELTQRGWRLGRYNDRFPLTEL